MQGSFPGKPQFPSSKGWLSPVKDGVVHLLPNEPSSNYKDFHEERAAEIAFCLLHHSMECEIKPPMDSQMMPACLTEGTCKKQVKCYFFP
jgi:hypothetical protein